MIQANLEDFYFSKLHNLLEAGYRINKIDSRHFSDLLVDTKNCVPRFSRLWIFEDLYLLVIREMYDQIAFGYSGWQKIINLLVHNYY